MLPCGMGLAKHLRGGCLRGGSAPGTVGRRLQGRGFAPGLCLNSSLFPYCQNTFSSCSAGEGCGVVVLLDLVLSSV